MQIIWHSSRRYPRKITDEDGRYFSIRLLLSLRNKIDEYIRRILDAVGAAWMDGLDLLPIPGRVKIIDSEEL